MSVYSEQRSYIFVMSMCMEQRSNPCHIFVHGTKVVSLTCMCAWNNGHNSVMSVCKNKGRNSVMSVCLEQRSNPSHIFVHGTAVASQSCICTWNNGHIPAMCVYIEER